MTKAAAAAAKATATPATAAPATAPRNGAPVKAAGPPISVTDSAPPAAPAVHVNGTAAAPAPDPTPPEIITAPVVTKPVPAVKVAAVRPPEPWSAAELAAVRTQLLGELSDMQGEYNRSLDDLNVLHQTGADGAGDDQADAGSKTFEREQELSIAANRFDLLNQIRRAIERVDARTYGHCESCGRPIPKARLKAFPMATLDVECKQREERR